tara:strand:- start:2119 stop:2772 length:654 start_codon:yes stop_codon:yes gene_type:complete
MDTNFDVIVIVIVIGAGPGGDIAAIRAEQLGMNVACVDAWKTKEGKPTQDGTCNNIGCIPSKALLQSSKNLDQAKHHFGALGIMSTGELRMDVAVMLERKNQVVKSSNEGKLYLFRKNKVQFLNGLAFMTRAAVGLELDGRGAVVVNGELAHQRAQYLGHRRCGARPDASAHGRGRRCRCGRAQKVSLWSSALQAIAVMSISTRSPTSSTPARKSPG